ncbi:MAG: hypothetical protein JSU63_11360 [Phycisphaerales bacterium]|nr:MAG: hypothetical protein JSU63_11360 [Phycisphaerales bacterium]
MHTQRTVYSSLLIPLSILTLLLATHCTGSVRHVGHRTQSIAATIDIQGWRSDIDFLLERIRSVHPNPWFRIPEEEFVGHAQQLKEDIPSLDTKEITVRIMQLVALLRDGHTLLPLGGNPSFTHWFPLRLDQFSDGVFITAIDNAYAKLVGAKVLRIGNLSALEAFRRVASATSIDSCHSIPKEVPAYISNATILKALKIIDTGHSLPLELQIHRTERVKISIPSVEWRANFGWARNRYHIPADSESVNVFSDKMDKLPLHLKNLLTKGDYYWFELLPDYTTLYVQFNSVNDAETETFHQFVERLWDYYDEHSEMIDKFVLDIRYNDGGNGYILQPLIHEFIKHEEISKRGSLYVITGRTTFSAAVRCLAQIIEHTDAITVGEPTSGPLNWFSDTELFELPYSGLYLLVSQYFWQKGHPSDERGYCPPDFPVPVTSQDYFSGTDQALEAILNDRVITLEDILQNEGIGAFMAEYERRKERFVHCDWWFPYTEFELRSVGYDAFIAGKVDDAISVAKLNTIHHPKSYKVWDDLAHIYRTRGDNKKAVECYRRSSDLNSGRVSTKYYLNELQGEADKAGK